MAGFPFLWTGAARTRAVNRSVSLAIWGRRIPEEEQAKTLRPKPVCLGISPMNLAQRKGDAAAVRKIPEFK
jgi:hypothetical protein